MPPLKIQGQIRRLCFRGQTSELPRYTIDDFDINGARASGIVEHPNHWAIAYSRWSSPKRTRSYPFARIYDTYWYSGKIVTVIPIVKDEGRGERRNDSNLDRITYITYSWMNLMNVYIVLAWYDSAQKQSHVRLTRQKLNSAYVRDKLCQIAEYKYDAHHWNKQHFRDDFLWVYEKAIESYRSISQRLGVGVHDIATHERFLDEVRDNHDQKKLDLERFCSQSLDRSYRAAANETATRHELERLSGVGTKALFVLRNNLGGTYYLTADDVEIEPEGSVVIRECKHTTRHILPSLNDIKDGLFKLLLFAHLDSVQLGDDKQRKTRCELRLTSSKFDGELHLPSEPSVLERYCNTVHLGDRAKESLKWLNTESERLGIPVILEKRSDE